MTRLADLGGAGEADHVDVGVLGQTVADDPAGPGHDVEDAFGQPGVLGELGEADRGARGQVGGLDDGRAADGQGEGQLLADDQEREVPGRDHADDADRLPQDQPEHRWAERVVRVAVGVPAQGRRVLPEVGGGDDLVERLADRLAGLESLDQRQVIGIGPDRIGDAVDHARALDARDARPRTLVECLPSGSDRPIEILDAARGIATDHDVVRRAHPLGRAAVGGIDPLAVDEVLIVAGGDGRGSRTRLLGRDADGRPRGRRDEIDEARQRPA